MAGGFGRPTDYNQELAETICVRLAEGESLKSICDNEDMPARRSVLYWLHRHPDFMHMYTRAREIQAETMFDDLIDIADDGRNDWMERNGPDNDGYVINGEAVQRSRLRIDARKWAAARLLPRKYGDRSEISVEANISHDHKPRELAAAMLVLLREAMESGRDKPLIEHDDDAIPQG